MNAPLPAGLQFRAARRDDGPAVQSLIFEVLREHGLSPDPTDTDSDLADLESSYAARGGMFGVIEHPDSGGIIGTVALMPLSSGVFELRKMYLRRERRGQGLGRWLLNEAIADARRRGARRLVLETARVLQRAVTLYREAGFREQPASPHAARCDLVMTLELEPPAQDASS